MKNLFVALSVMIAFVLMGWLGACGSSALQPTAPTITRAVDAAGTELSSSQTVTGVDPTNFAVTFSEAMDPASLTASGAIVLTCNGLPASVAQPTVVVTEVEDGTHMNFLVTVYGPDNEAPWRYQLLTCTVTATGEIRSAAGGVLADESYSFTNGCALNDDFNADSMACWTPAVIVFDGQHTTWSTWEDILAQGLTLFSTAESALVFNDSEAAIPPDGFVIGIEKTVVVDGDEVNLYMHLKDIVLNDYDDAVGFELIFPDGKTFSLVKGGEEESPGLYVEACSLYYQDDVDEFIKFSVCNGGEYFLRLQIVSGVSIKAFYALTEPQDDSGWTEITEGDPMPAVSFSGEARLLLDFAGDNNGNASASVEAVTATGLTAQGQY